MARLLKNNFFISFIIIISIIFLHTFSILSPLENLIAWTLSPFQNLIYTASEKTTQEISKILSRQDYLSENNELKNKIKKLEQKIVAQQIFIEENNLLQAQNEFLKTSDHEFINARVIGNGIDNNTNLLLINRGSQDGIQSGLAVVGEYGYVVGKIIKTDPHRSYLLLLTDNSSKISASLAGKSEISGLVEGRNNISLNLNYVIKDNPLNSGDMVVTSGEDSRIPSGLLIGTVDKIKDLSNELFKSANLVSQVNFKHLIIVSIILN